MAEAFQPVPRVGDERPQLLVVKGIEATTALDPYLDTKALVGYSGCSERWLRAKRADPLHPLPHYRVGAKVLHRRSEFDTWLARYRQVSRHPDVQRAVRYGNMSICRAECVPAERRSCCHRASG